MKKLSLVIGSILILAGCASNTGIDYKIVWDAQCRAFFNTSTFGLDFARRAVDADKVLENGVCVIKVK